MVHLPKVPLSLQLNNAIFIVARSPSLCRLLTWGACAQLFRRSLLTLAIGTPLPTLADPSALHSLEQIEVKGRRLDWRGESSTASAGVIGNSELSALALVRPGEVLETVPGMVVTQHSGNGKANQYFLRGFNLDHGTDFQLTLDGMPLNMRSHGHGQGYADLNMLMPELVQQLNYQKGPYAAEAMDFSGAGGADFALQNLTRDAIQLETGAWQYQRALAKGDTRLGAGNLLAAAEWLGYDGPWTDTAENLHKTNTLLRYSQPIGAASWSLTAMHYQNNWRSADQIPQRLVKTGQLSSLGSIDQDTGGDSQRSSLSSQYRSDDWRANVYWIRSDLQLWSNFTYFLADPLNGDEFEQLDDRTLFGGALSRQGDFGTAWHWQIGIQTRIDDIAAVGLFNTKARQRLAAVRLDSVRQQSIGVFAALDWQINDDWLWQFGGRTDQMRARVDNQLVTDGRNSGKASAQLPSLKSSLSYAINDHWALFASAGQAYHSNDARGVVTTQDPLTGDAVDPVDFLARSFGSELGVRYFDAAAINLSLTMWQLDSDSELVYVGDAGSNEPSRASFRQGFEFAGYYWLDEQLELDAELAFTRSRYRALPTESLLNNPDAAGEKYVEGALPQVFSFGISWHPQQRWSLSTRLRHFGARQLAATGDIKSASSTTLNANVQYAWRDYLLVAELLNALDSSDHDIDYYYASRLKDEPQDGVLDQHFHPLEPRALRLKFRYQF